MPNKRRKGVPGRSTLPPDFVHNPLNAAAAASPLLNLLGLCQQPLSLGNLQAPSTPLALTFPGSKGAPSSRAAESVKSASAWDCWKLVALVVIYLVGVCVFVPLRLLVADHALEGVGTWLAQTPTI